MVGNHQPVTLAAMEGRFVGGPMAGVALIGQPNVAARRLDNPIEIPGALSFLAYGHFGSYVHGLDDFPEESWPDNIELLYYSFHLMITLGTIFILLMAYAELPELARPAGIQHMAALGADARLPISLHRQHAGLDDGGVGTPTLADLRSFSHIRWLQQSS